MNDVRACSACGFELHPDDPKVYLGEYVSHRAEHCASLLRARLSGVEALMSPKCDRCGDPLIGDPRCTIASCGKPGRCAFRGCPRDGRWWIPEITDAKVAAARWCDEHRHDGDVIELPPGEVVQAVQFFEWSVEALTMVAAAYDIPLDDLLMRTP